MTVHQLIGKLSQLLPNQEIFISTADSGLYLTSDIKIKMFPVVDGVNHENSCIVVPVGDSSKIVTAICGKNV